MELVKTNVNRDLSNGIPVLASVIRLMYLFLENPMSGVTNITDIIRNVQTVRSLLDTSAADTQHIVSDLNDIIETFIRLITTITHNPQE
jgi:signal-transduction protein with cAMP-binding, CBS, and nucleotidyltransferase domain